MRRIALVLVLFVLLPMRASALHQRTPPFLQITEDMPGGIAHPRWAGHNYVLFDAESGSSGRQIFLFDLADRVLHGAKAITKLATEDGSDPQRASADQRARRIVYDARPGGLGPRQLFLLDRRQGTRSALTRGAGDSQNAVIAATGRVVVFESTADFFSSGVGGMQLYSIALKDFVPTCPYPCAATGNAGLTAITAKLGTSRNAVPNYGGNTIVFESDADLLDLGETETQIYVYQRQGALKLLSHGPGPSRNPSLSLGGLIAFESEADLARRGTGGTQVFLVRGNKEAQQLTAAPGGNSHHPSVAGVGMVVSFVSTDDLLGLGSSGPEIYVYDLRNGGLTQVTDVPATASAPATGAGIFFDAFLADGDLLGNGSQGTQLYLVNRLPLGSQLVP